MKFGEYLLQNRLAQFSAWYIDYELLKQDISYAKSLIKQIDALCSLQGIEVHFKLDETEPFDFSIYKAKIIAPTKEVIRFEVSMDREFNTEEFDGTQTVSGSLPPILEATVAASSQQDVVVEPTSGGDNDTEGEEERGQQVQFIGLDAADTASQSRTDRHVAGFCNVKEDPSTLGRGWKRALKSGAGGYTVLNTSMSRRPSSAAMLGSPRGTSQPRPDGTVTEPYAAMELTSMGDLTPPAARILLKTMLEDMGDPLTPKSVKMSPIVTPRAGEGHDLVSKTIRVFPGVSSECKLQLCIDIPKEAFAQHGLSSTHAHLALYLMQHQINDRFRHNWLEQITKVETFYNRESQLLSTAVAGCIDTVKKFRDMKDDERNQLRTAFRQMLHHLDSLQQFCDLNVQAVAKILKKFDKVTRQDSLRAYHHVFPLFSFATGHPNRINLLKEDLINAYTKYITHGDKKKAMEHLFLKDKAQQLHDRIPQASMASAMGTFTLLLAILAIVEVANLPQPLKVDNAHNTSYIVGTTGVLLILPILFSWNVYLWESYNINYQFMFELDIDGKWDPLQVLRGSLAYAMIWAACTYAFARSATNELACESSGVLRNESAIPAWIWPYLIVPLWLVWLFVRRLFRDPKKVHLHEWLLGTLLRILATPFLTVRFSDFFICDQLTSLGGVLFELQFFWCIFQSSNATQSCSDGRAKHVFAAAMLPNIWRFLQCIRRYKEPDEEHRVFFPHGVNACKYLSSIFDQFGGFYYAMAKFYATDDANHEGVEAALAIYMIFKLFSTIYKCFWDVMVDFAVIRVGTFEFRKERMYGPGWIYVGVCVLDITLRFAWLVSFGMKMHVDAEWIPFLFAAIEVIRRAIWNCFRVENEQVNNIENYRTTLLAPLPSRHVDETFYGGNAADIQRRFSKADIKTERGIRSSNWSTITRFFACLPEEEKVTVLRMALPSRRFDGVQFSGKSKAFSELPEETKVHVILEQIGDLTMSEYAAQFATPVTTAAQDGQFPGSSLEIPNVDNEEEHPAQQDPASSAGDDDDGEVLAFTGDSQVFASRNNNGDDEEMKEQ